MPFISVFKQRHLENFKADGICGIGLTPPTETVESSIIDNLKNQ